MYIIVNNDLSMGKGKIAGQCCHSSCNVIRILERNEKNSQIYNEWIKTGETKIVLKATQLEMEKIFEEYQLSSKNSSFKNSSSKSIWCVCIHDAGRTQIPENSLTSIAFCPIIRSETPEFIKNMKLL